LNASLQVGLLRAVRILFELGHAMILAVVPRGEAKSKPCSLRHVSGSRARSINRRTSRDSQTDQIPELPPERRIDAGGGARRETRQIGNRDQLSRQRAENFCFHGRPESLGRRARYGNRGRAPVAFKAPSIRASDASAAFWRINRRKEVDVVRKQR